MPGRDTGVYSIGIIARLTGLHEQTIRQYERLGLITPQRSAGGTRVFSEHDLERLNSIASMTRDLGVNLAGVEVILKMRDRHDKMLSLVREMFNLLDEGARARFELLLRGDEPGLVPLGQRGLAVAQPEPPSRKRKIEIKGEDKE
jgi:MerR family transcriptional regulator, heat shock protein HspR